MTTGTMPLGFHADRAHILRVTPGKTRVLLSFVIIQMKIVDAFFRHAKKIK